MEKKNKISLKVLETEFFLSDYDTVREWNRAEEMGISDYIIRNQTTGWGEKKKRFREQSMQEAMDKTLNKFKEDFMTLSVDGINATKEAIKLIIHELKDGRVHYRDVDGNYIPRYANKKDKTFAYLSFSEISTRISFLDSYLNTSNSKKKLDEIGASLEENKIGEDLLRSKIEEIKGLKSGAKKK